MQNWTDGINDDVGIDYGWGTNDTIRRCGNGEGKCGSSTMDIVGTDKDEHQHLCVEGEAREGELREVEAKMGGTSGKRGEYGMIVYPVTIIYDNSPTRDLHLFIKLEDAEKWAADNTRDNTHCYVLTTGRELK